MNRITRFIGCIPVLAILWGVTGCAGGNLPPGGQGGPEIAPGGVVFRYFDRDAQRVYVVGDFNNWTLYADAMVDKNGDGEWTLFYGLRPGRYEYKFVINGVTWIADPRNPSSVPDGFEGRNSVVVVPAAR